MKKFIICIVALFATFTVNAQDILVTDDGDAIKAYNVEVATNKVYYTIAPKSEDTKAIVKSKILVWKKADGTKVVLTQTENDDKVSETVSNSVNTPKFISRHAASNNQDLINKYRVSLNLKNPKEKKAQAIYATVAVFDFTPESILSNEDLEISFVRESECKLLNEYEILIMNKTDKHLYLDLGNSFRVPSKGNSRCYYDGITATVNSGAGTGAAMNLGGITSALGIGGTIGSLAGGLAVGGGNSSSVSKSYSQQRVISIPPHGHRALSEFKYLTSGNKSELVSKGEIFDFGEELNIHKGFIMQDEVKNYTVENTPLKIDYIITYSNDINFNTYSTLNMTLFVNKMIGHSMHRDGFGGWRSVICDKKTWLKEFDSLNPNLIFGMIYILK